jgi:hypothetical protein
MKQVVIGIIIKRVEGEMCILTQMRLVQNKSYDPLYDHTWEAMGETLEQGESVIEALIRGLGEECGCPSGAIQRIYGNYGTKGHAWSTGKGDSIVTTDPFCFVQQMGPPQPWIGPAFIVEVSSDFEPENLKSEGEVGEYRWWTAPELQRAVSDHPEQFMGLHLPAYGKLCSAIIDGKF